MSDAPDAISDAELVRQCTEESRPEAFEELMSRYHRRVYAVVVRLVPDADHALDIVQETFMKAWRGLAGFKGSASFYTWLYRIARNVVSSDARRARARPQVAVSLDGNRTDDADRSFDLAGLEQEPLERTLRLERQRRILAAIQSLAPDFREVIVLCDIEDQSYEEISVMLEVPLGTVRSRLHRARLELRARLADLSP